MRLIGLLIGSALLLQPATAFAQFYLQNLQTGLGARADIDVSYTYSEGDGPLVQYAEQLDERFALFPSTGPIDVGVTLANPSWVDGRTTVLTAAASASARPGILKAFGAIAKDPDDVTGAEGGAQASASFVDGFTVTGNAPRVQFTLTSRFSGGVTDFGSAGQNFDLEAPSDAGLQLVSYGLFGIGATGWNQVSSCQSGGPFGNTYCTLIAQKQFYGSDAFNLRQFYTFEVDSDATLWLGLSIGGGSGTVGALGGAVDLTNTGVFDGFSGSGLTGVNSGQFGALRSVGGKFTYEDVHALNAAAVPEPASWAMLIAGFGLVGAVARRRRTQVAVA